MAKELSFDNSKGMLICALSLQEAMVESKPRQSSFCLSVWVELWAVSWPALGCLCPGEPCMLQHEIWTSLKPKVILGHIHREPCSTSHHCSWEISISTQSQKIKTYACFPSCWFFSMNFKDDAIMSQSKEGKCTWLTHLLLLWIKAFTFIKIQISLMCSLNVKGWLNHWEKTVISGRGSGKALLGFFVYLFCFAFCFCFIHSKLSFIY